ncbi:hypothetical protein M405DRAFT_880746 [Rhizopogon salebrosus TDB-379]|nr:hypothetical protein M405DRAFT_880746 [Rhizopogon salebrosus TDB-379]
MRAIAQSPFVDLPIELVMLIISFAAYPSFVQIGDRRSHAYSSALALCRVCRNVRRVVLPIMLETMFLWEDRNVIAFVHALRMQAEYTQQGNHLRFQYPVHIRRICMGRIYDPFAVSNDQIIDFIHDPWLPPAIDFSILAPVALAVPSLAIDFERMHVLRGCLEYAWRGRTYMEHSLLPWRTKTLTFSGMFDPTSFLKGTDQGSAFLASISHLIFLPPVITETEMESAPYGSDEKPRFPSWMKKFSWKSFKSIQTVSLPLPYVRVSNGICYTSGRRMELLTLSAPPDQWRPKPGFRPWNTYDIREWLSRWVHKDMDIHPATGGGRVSLPQYVARKLILAIDWEETWACVNFLT